MNRFSACVLVAAFALLGTTASRAGDLHQTSSISVQYSDLDVTRAQGAIVLVSRIDAAAHVACGPEPDNRDLTGHALFVACYTNAENNAIDHLGNPLVSKLASRGGYLKTAGN